MALRRNAIILLGRGRFHRSTRPCHSLCQG